MQQMTIDGFDALLNVLPYWMRGLVEEHAERLEEICLDRGKPLCFKFTEGFKVFERLVDQDDLEQVMCEVGVARSDGRTGIDSTLHRVATVTNRYGAVTGYTIRVGRYIQGVAEPLRELFLDTGASLALFGPPNSGKSTLIREATRMLAETVGPRLCVVDASNEIAGDGDIPHSLLGAGRRLQVPDPRQLADKLIEGLINHGPVVMIVDELARPSEVDNIIRIVQRGVRVVACLHGDTAHKVVRNPDYAPLLGLREGERRAPAIFSSVVELRHRGVYCHYSDLNSMTDAVLAGELPAARWLPLDTLPDLRRDLALARRANVQQPIEEVIRRVFCQHFSATMTSNSGLEHQPLYQQSYKFLEEVSHESFDRSQYHAEPG